MNTVSIPALDARRQLGELLEKAYYQNQQFRIMRKDKPMAYLIGEGFMNQLSTVIDQVIENDPALADTLTLQLNPELKALIEQGTKEKEDGHLVPLTSILDD